MITQTDAFIEAILEKFPKWRPYVDLIVVPPTAEEVREEFPDVGRLAHDEYAMTSYGVSRLAVYVIRRREGNCHRMADMMAAQAGPKIMTDDVFFQGIPRLAEQFGSQKLLDQYIANARKHGYNPSPNDMYHPGLARFRGDPEAFVSKSQGRGYIKRLCEKRGWGCEGAVNIEARAPESDPLAPERCQPLAEDIVRESANDMVRKNPELAHKSKSELRQMVLQKHGPTS